MQTTVVLLCFSFLVLDFIQTNGDGLGIVFTLQVAVIPRWVSVSRMLYVNYDSSVVNLVQYSLRTLHN